LYPKNKDEDSPKNSIDKNVEIIRQNVVIRV